MVIASETSDHLLLYSDKSVPVVTLSSIFSTYWTDIFHLKGPIHLEKWLSMNTSPKQNMVQSEN